MDYCKLCENRMDCFSNHWCVTMDAKRVINGEYVCDNFELSGRQYELLKRDRQDQEQLFDMMANDMINRVNGRVSIYTGCKTDDCEHCAYASSGTCLKCYYIRKLRGD